MKNRHLSWKTLLLVLSLPIIAAASPRTANAFEPIPGEDGFSGNINLGLGVLQYESNLIASATTADVGTQRATLLTAAPRSRTLALPMFSFEVRYTFAQPRTQVFFGTQVRDYLILSHVSSLGVRQETQRFGRFQVALLSTPSNSKVWRDPYVTGTDRVSTAQTAKGVQLDWGRVLNTNLGIGFSTSKLEINNEASGAALVANGSLTEAQAQLLDRNGTAGKVDINYTFVAKGPIILTPDLSHIKVSSDGKAIANSGYMAGLTLIAPLIPDVSLVSNLSFGRMRSDTVNPVFGKKYDKTHLGVLFDVLYKNPFGLDNWTGGVVLGYFREDNKIDFYDTRSTLAALSMRYDF